MRRVLLVVASAMAVLFGGIALAAPASAYDGNACIYQDYQVVNGTTVVLTYTGGDCTLIDLSEFVPGATIVDATVDGVGTVSVTITASDQWVVLAFGDPLNEPPYPNQFVAGCDVAAEFYDDLIVLGCGGSEMPDQTPPPVGQGVGLPASGSCADVSDDAPTFARDIKGGWTKSWEPWANANGAEGDKWGWACVRTLVYSGSGWQVQAA